MALLVQIPDGFWILSTRPVSKWNTKFCALHQWYSTWGTRVFCDTLTKYF